MDFKTTVHVGLRYLFILFILFETLVRTEWKICSRPTAKLPIDLNIKQSNVVITDHNNILFDNPLTQVNRYTCTCAVVKHMV